MPSPFFLSNRGFLRGTSRYSGQVLLGRFPDAWGYVGKKRPQAGVVSAWGGWYERGKILVLRRRSSDYFGGNLGFVKRAKNSHPASVQLHSGVALRLIYTSFLATQDKGYFKKITLSSSHGGEYTHVLLEMTLLNFCKKIRYSLFVLVAYTDQYNPH